MFEYVAHWERRSGVKAPEEKQFLNYMAQASCVFLDAVACTVPPNSKTTDRRTHPYAAGLLFALEGSARFTVDGEVFAFQPGMIAHFGANAMMNKEVTGDKHWKYVVIHYTIPESEATTCPFYAAHAVLVRDATARAMHLLDRLVQLEGNPDSLSVLKSKTLFANILEEVALCVAAKQGQKGRNQMEDAIEYLHSHYSAQFTVEELASRHGLQAKRFCYLFRKQTGMSPIQFLLELRVHKAKELLAHQTDLPVSHIADAVGYRDSFYFSRLFKKVTSYSPTEYRALFGK